MNRINLTMSELKATQVGEAITLSLVLALLAIAVGAVVVYKLFTSTGGGTVKIPGGWQFVW